jgi:CheY-like chemotaxis protein
VNRVLIVEDEPDVAEVVADVLEAGGYAPLIAGNGHEALELLRGGYRPHLIILDMMMPVVDGRAFRREQQRIPEIADIPVVLLTADGHTAQKAAAIGAHGYLTKPIGIQALLGEVRRHCDPPGNGDARPRRE